MKISVCTPPVLSAESTDLLPERSEQAPHSPSHSSFLVKTEQHIRCTVEPFTTASFTASVPVSDPKP